MSVDKATAACTEPEVSSMGLIGILGADAVDIGKTIHPRPTLGESIGQGGGGGAWQLHGCAANMEVIN